MSSASLEGGSFHVDACAVLFDMDGLLVDSEPLWLEAETAVVGRLGGAEWTKADQLHLLGGSLDRTVRYLLTKAPEPVPPDVVGEWLMSEIAGRVREHGVPVRPGARELLAAVSAAGLPRALVTSSERRFMDTVLASTGMRFDVLVCAEDVSATKPAPEPYLLAAKLLEVDPGGCVALEDSPNGVASAQAAGCRVIAVPSLLPIEAAAGRVVVRSLLDLQADPTGMTVLARGNQPGNPPEPPPRGRTFPLDPLRGVSPSALRDRHTLDLERDSREARMSTYDKIAWLPLCGGLTGLGLVLSYLVMRRRGIGSGLRAAAWSLLPVAAYLTGAIEMFWKIGVAIGDFATGFVFSPKVWSGIALAGVAVFLFFVGGGLRRRRVKRNKDTPAAAPADAATGALPAAGSRQLATRAAPAVPAQAPGKVPVKTRKGKAADQDDDDLGDVADILRRHGIT